MIIILKAVKAFNERNHKLKGCVIRNMGKWRGKKIPEIKFQENDTQKEALICLPGVFTATSKFGAPEHDASVYCCSYLMCICCTVCALLFFF